MEILEMSWSPFRINKNPEKIFSGTEGEDTAARYLEKKGYEIIKRNYRTCGAEIDLIAKKGETLCFVEVKTRKSGDFGLPEEFVDFWKRRKIIRAARVFIGRRKYADMYVRFDIVSVVYDGVKTKINHIQDAFEEE
jgi:putative endonuclease